MLANFSGREEKAFKGVPSLSLLSDVPIAEFAGNSVPFPILEYPLPDRLQSLTRGQLMFYLWSARIKEFWKGGLPFIWNRQFSSSQIMN